MFRFAGIAAFFLISSTAFAQSEADRNNSTEEFFEPNFVTEGKPTPAAQEPKETAKGDTAVVKKQKPGAGFFEFEDETDSPSVVPAGKGKRSDRDVIIPDAVDTGEKVLNLHLIASTDDVPHLKQYTRTYGRILTTREVDGKGVTIVLKNMDPKDALSEVYDVLGEELQDRSQRDYSEEELQKLGVVGVQSLLEEQMRNPLVGRRIASVVGTHVAMNIPPQYPVTMLPSWILETEKGAIILEGLEDPSSMITKNGKFLPPQGVDAEAAAASNPAETVSPTIK